MAAPGPSADANGGGHRGAHSAADDDRAPPHAELGGAAAQPASRSARLARMSLLMLTLLVLLLALPGGLAQRAQHAAATACSRQHSAWLSELRPSESGVELELTALAGMNLASWSLVGYDSRSGSCGSCLQMDVFLFTRTTVVPNQEATGLGTLHLVGAASTDGPGPIDAIALLDGVSGTVVELVSWGGSSFVAADGPAEGDSSCSVAAATAAQALQEQNAETLSLQRQDASQSWVLAEPSFGHLNTHMTKPAVGRLVDLTSREVWINEIEYGTGGAGDDLRVEIAGEAGASLAGWWLEYYNGAGSGGGGNCGADHPLGEGGGGGGAGGISGNGCPSFDRRTVISSTTRIPDERNGFGAVVLSAVGLAHGPISGVALVQPLEAAPVGTSPVEVVDFVAFNGARFRATDGSAVLAVSTSTGIPIDQRGASLQLLGGPGWCTWVAGTATSFGRLNAGQLLVQGHSSSVLRLATVVTPGWSGVMDELINRFEQQHQIRVEMFSSFDVYEQMEHGDADMVISHYKKDDGRTSTKRFIMTGLGHWPKMLFSNTAVIVGPSHDPAGIRGERDAARAVAKIAAAGEHLSFAEVPENEFTFDLLWRAAGGDSIGRDWMSIVDTPDDAGDGSKVMDAFHQGHYYVWGLIPFLKWKERNSEVAMEAMVWDEQLFRHVMCSVVVRQEAFPRANVRAALLFEQHLLSAESQAYMHSFRDHGHDGPLWFPRAVDNIGHPIYPPYPGEDPIAENFTSAFSCSEDAADTDTVGADGSGAAAHTAAAVPLPLLRTATSIPGRGLDVTLSIDVARFAGSPLHMTTRAYNGTFPGPVLRVRRGDNIRVRLVNNLASGPEDDQAYDDTHPNPNATNLHLHGMHVPATAYDQASNSCGDDVSTCVVQPQHSVTYRYKVDEDHPSGTFWYHPHVHGTTALQVGGLMAGMLIVEDEPEETPHELAAMVEVMLVLQMQYWDSLGVATHDTISAQLHDALDMDASGPRGNYILANGQHKPVVSLVANQYARFRVLNANEVATMELDIPRGSHCSMDVLAMDGVYLKRPSHVTHGLVLVPGSRVDLAVRCRRAGEYVLRSNPDPARDGSMGRHARIAQDILVLAVAEPQPGAAELPLPTHLPQLPTHMQDDLQYGSPDETSAVTLGDVQNSDYYQINGEVDDGSIQRTVRLGSLQEWRITADGSNMHPFHAHLNHFQVISVDGPTENAALVGVGQWRDTIPIPAAGVAVTVRFRAHRFCGVMPYHCHILHHSDMGMAARLAVIGTASECQAVEARQIDNTDASQYCGPGTRWDASTQLCDADSNATNTRAFIAALLGAAAALACVAVFKSGSLSLQTGKSICCPLGTASRTAGSKEQASALDIALSCNHSDGGEGDSL
jgi:FtsP/CotA-like multicopper oxidase with cupredoxin domain/ABC-type tungstate transport system permease subunit